MEEDPHQSRLADAQAAGNAPAGPAFPPLLVEAIKYRIDYRPTKPPFRISPSVDSCLISVLSYAGLRPGETLALTWGGIGRRTIAVDKAIADGRVGPTKTGSAARHLDTV